MPLWSLALVRRKGPGVASTLEVLHEEVAALRGGAKAEGPAVGEAATAVVGLAVGQYALGNDAAAVAPEVEGAAQGPLSLNLAGPPVVKITTSAVIRQQQILRTLRNVDSGAMRLEPDHYIDGRWITVADTLTSRPVELLTDLTHDVLSVSHKLASAKFVSVYHITGQVVEKQHSEVTATDWL